MRHIKDLYWLAGLLEGEGCFRLRKVSPVIQLHMTDKDIVDRVRNLMSPASTVGIFVRYGAYKTVYSLNLYGATAASWMMTLYPLMGNRRQTIIREILTTWKGTRIRRQKKVA